MTNIKLQKIFLFSIIFLSGFFVFKLNLVQAYTPPIGIPNPKNNWGALDPIEQVTPTWEEKCPNWPSAATTDCYYVDPSHPSATDTSNPYGYPDKPRLTMAQGTYNAGTYMFLGGQLLSATINLVFNCTEENPCWVTSNSTDQGGFSGNGRMSLQTSSYLFIENLLIADKPVNYSAGAISISNTPNTTTSAHHIVIRNNIIRDIEYTSPNSVYSTNARDGGNSHDIVIYNNSFTNVGDPNDTVDKDLHSVGIGIRDTLPGTESYNIWVLNNSFKNSTQGLQINAAAREGIPKLHHIYVGFNYGENERQRSLSTKYASHVIFSQNEVIPGVNQAAGGYSESMGWSLGADHVWFIFNNIHSGADGLRNSDDTGSTQESSRVFIIGNWFHDLQLNDLSTTLNSGYALNFEHGRSTVWVIDNTIDTGLGGLITQQNGPAMYVSGNIFNTIDSSRSFVNFNQALTIGVINFANNLYYANGGTPRWEYTSSVYLSYDNWMTQYPQFAADSVYANSQIGVNGIPLEGSPAIGANKNENTEYGYPDVYALFESLYGINIRVDYNGKHRPTSGPWTLGAFEASEYVPDTTAPSSPTNLSVL